jgi:hypothetical protein
LSQELNINKIDSRDNNFPVVIKFLVDMLLLLMVLINALVLL